MNLEQMLEMMEMEGGPLTPTTTTTNQNDFLEQAGKGKMKAKKFSTNKRTKLAKSGIAKPDGSYPIENTTDLSNAVKDFYRAHGSPSDKAHIIKRAKALGVGNPFNK